MSIATGQYCWHATQARTAAATDLGCLPGRAQGHLARHRRGNRRTRCNREGGKGTRYPSRQADGDAAAMTRRKGEIMLPEIKRHWPHHVALPADKVRGVMNRQVV